MVDLSVTLVISGLANVAIQAEPLPSLPSLPSLDNELLVHQVPERVTKFSALTDCDYCQIFALVTDRIQKTVGYDFWPY